MKKIIITLAMIFSCLAVYCEDFEPTAHPLNQAFDPYRTNG